MFFGILNKVVLMILPFVVKSIINNYLGVEYLGLNSLFSSILQVLLLSEMGFSSALVYHMYKPIAENDQDTINALLNLYRKAYLIIGSVVIVIGVVIIPVLPCLIKGNYPTDVNIIIIYIIQLVNTALSYFLFGYKQSLLVAYQREDINSIINLVVQAGLQMVQILLLIITKNYYFYIICMPIATILNNIWIGIATKRIFPNAKCKGHFDKDTLADIKKLVVGTFIQKACATTRNSLDSICISAFMGLALTGIYNNYYTILNGLTVILGIVGTSLSGGIGNHVVIKSRDENFMELKKLDFLYMGISGWVTECLLCIYQPFMKLWMGENMLLPFNTVIILCVYYYILKIGDMKYLYSTANGLWWKMRYRSIAETVCNIVLNIGLGLVWGVNGIVLATIISLLSCNFIWAASILFSNYFGKKKLKQYYLYHIKYALFTLVVCIISYFLCSIIKVDHQFWAILIRGIICTIVFIICFLIVNGKNILLKDSIKMIRK